MGPVGRGQAPGDQEPRRCGHVLPHPPVDRGQVAVVAEPRQRLLDGLERSRTPSHAAAASGSNPGVTGDEQAKRRGHGFAVEAPLRAAEPPAARGGRRGHREAGGRQCWQFQVPLSSSCGCTQPAGMEGIGWFDGQSAGTPGG